MTTYGHQQKEGSLRRLSRTLMGRAVPLGPLIKLALLLVCLSTSCLGRPAGLEQYSLVRVVDGDTLVVTKPGADPEVHVRLLGIDCLESRRIERLDKQALTLGIPTEMALSLGKATTVLVEQLVWGHPIYLELEGINDKYGRLIAYVWTNDDQSLNLQLLTSGQAMVYDGGNAFKRQDEFQAAECAARAKQVGIWAARIPSPAAAPEPASPPSPPRGVPTPMVIILVLFLAVVGVLIRTR
jgi:micrococcal nuclease